MGPRPSLLLVLGLCLVRTVHTQDGLLPKPSIRAEPGPVIRWGQPVTIVCRGPTWADTFRLEVETRRPLHWDERLASPHGSDGTEARFRIDAVSDDSAGSYFCLYRKGSGQSVWSVRSEPLQLKVADEDAFPPPSESSTSRAAPEGTGHTQTNSPEAKTISLSTEHLYILVGVCVASLLCLLLLVTFLVCHKHQKKRGPPSSKGEEPRPRERLSPTADLMESPADVATTVDAVPEEIGDTRSPSPAAGDPEEVTYAQLDQRALTRRAARAETPPPTEATVESSMYAALPRHGRQDHPASAPGDTDVPLAKED